MWCVVSLWLCPLLFILPLGLQVYLSVTMASIPSPVFLRLGCDVQALRCWSHIVWLWGHAVGEKNHPAPPAASLLSRGSDRSLWVLLEFQIDS